MGALTDVKCKNAKPKAKVYRLADGNGLYLEVKPNGVKAWRYRFELGGKENMFALGSYESAPAGQTKEAAELRRAAGRLTLAEAREERLKARGLVKQGFNPAAQRELARIKREQANALTFEKVAAEWLATKDWEQVTKTRREQMLKRVVYPTIGKLPVDQVKPAHILDIFKRTAPTAPSVAAEAKRTMSAVFEFAISTLRAEVDPVYPVRKALPPNKTQHKRALTTTEIGQLLRDIQNYTGDFQTVSAFRLMWMTLCRPSEAIEAKWSEFDLDAATWRIPAERMKKRKEHLIPLSTQAVKLLQAMHGVTGQREHVFPHRDERTKPMTGNALRMALKNLKWSGRYSPHATRTTGSTRLNEMNFPSDWIERQLAHSEPNAVRRTYNHADHFESRRTMMQTWTDMLDALQAGGQVVPFKQAA